MKIRDPISTAEAAKILKVTQRHVRWLIAQRDLMAETIPGPGIRRDLYLSRAEVQKYQPRPKGRRKRA